MRHLRPFILLYACVLVAAHGQAPAAADVAVPLDAKRMHPPIAIASPEAQMPDAAPSQALNGICIIGVTVNKQGATQDLHVVRCTDPIFIDSSLAAVRKYKFRPATTLDGTPIAVKITVEVNYKFFHGAEPRDSQPPTRVSYKFLAPPDTASKAPDNSGTYPLSHAFDSPGSTYPQMVRFAGSGFGEAAMALQTGAGCTAVIKIDAKGKPSDAQLLQCDAPSLEQPALQSLLKSKYKPATLNGKAVPVKATIQLSYLGFAPTKTDTH